MHFFTVQFDKPEHSEALVVEVANGQSIADVLEWIYRTEPHRLTCDVVLIRPPVGRPINPNVVRRLRGGASNVAPELHFIAKSKAEVSGAFSRVPKRAVHLLFSHNYNHLLSPNIRDDVSRGPLDLLSVSDLPAIMENIGRAEIDELTAAGRAIFPGSPGIVYQAPSGELTRSFLRVGNIQRSRFAVDAIFFWLLPYLRECVGIIAELWDCGET